ncbi:MAG: hypothetical protein NVSMB31_07400 [Vulcanimicrobiaceae bacterium]
MLLAVTACSSSGGVNVPALSATPEPPATIAQTITSGITPNAHFFHMVTGPDGRVWGSEFQTSNVAAVTTAGVVSEYPMPALAQPNGMAVGSDGNIWTGGYGGIMLKVTTAGAYTAYPIAGAHIGAVVAGPGGLWFTDYGNGKVGVCTTAGVITEYPLPAGASPGGIALGGDGNLWVPDGSGAILKITPAGVVTKYTAGLTAGGFPGDIAAGSDGNLYFTEPFFSATLPDKVGRITTAGVINELGNLAPNSYPATIVLGGDQNMYFTEYSVGTLGRIAIPTGTVTEFPLAMQYGASALDAAPDGTLWVGATDRIYRVNY